jgi:hypothetical protein
VSGWERAGEPVRYDVFDGAGMRAATVELTAGRRIVAIGVAHAYVVRTDADDLQWLERYQLPAALRSGRASQT